jgi:RimJ/RimL family protein N-acetyltransferase
MQTDSLLVGARELWLELASVPVSFPAAGRVRVVVSPRSGIAPPGWVGAVLLAGSALVTAPDPATAGLVRSALATLPLTALAEADAGAVRAALPVDRVLGPAALAYASPEALRPVGPGALTLEQLPAEHPDLRALDRLAGEQDAGEAGMWGISSPAFTVRDGGAVVAAAGYLAWPSRTAHISVLTAPAWRGHGLARVTGTAATAHALAAGLLPQWRARVPASRRVATALGFRELGHQLSLHLTS